MSIKKFFAYLYDTVAKTMKIGDTSGSNYTLFESDGTMIAVGDATCYMDVVIPFLFKGDAGTEAVLDTLVGGLKQLKFAVNKGIDFENAEAPHNWKEGTGVEIHLHFTNKSLQTVESKVNWSVEFCFANMKNGINLNTVFANPAIPGTFGTVTVTFESIIPANTPAGTHLYASLTTVSSTALADYKIGSGFMGRLTRIAKTSGGADPQGDIFALNMGIHYVVDTLGSRTIAGK